MGHGCSILQTTVTRGNCATAQGLSVAGGRLPTTTTPGLSTDPTSAALVAAALLGERFSAGDALGGLLIVLAVAVNDELIRVPGRMCLAPHCVVDDEEA